ncbi:hypothetical protein PGT21_007510 [Puccinia graminis f. sp. tritici]|uniref:Uncharacterized protein n=1 Tax=Puccinia graminis f. sp. tritici TaxID=56615 RepID=A0A5B0PEB3_PUCGR|nr:hypothetical protein PGT21_007510 [Puccinia graminis f. sp. tritici]KAA1099062.1 hypothetical protein PGTUg99_010933 [Puccinia graminis f. sp. tritici]
MDADGWMISTENETSKKLPVCDRKTGVMNQDEPAFWSAGLSDQLTSYDLRAVTWQELRACLHNNHGRRKNHDLPVLRERDPLPPDVAGKAASVDPTPKSTTTSVFLSDRQDWGGSYHDYTHKYVIPDLGAYSEDSAQTPSTRVHWDD